MESAIQSNLLGLVVVVLVFGFAVTALVQATQALLKLRSRNLIRGVAQLLFEIVEADPERVYGRRRLWLLSKTNAKRLLLSESGRTATWVKPEDLLSAVQNAFPNWKEKAKDIGKDFEMLQGALAKRFTFGMRLLAFGWSILLAAAYRLNTPEHVLHGATPFPSLRFFSDSSVPFPELAGVLVTAILLTIVSQIAYSLLKKSVNFGDDNPDELMLAKARVETKRTIGRDGCAIRAINFSGGAFDTIMQLGVTHALLTIQGRAPDVVVGVSAGAVQAAALAEVLQAGEKHEEGKTWANLPEDEQSKLQLMRLKARVKRFRDFVAACLVARERLFDSVTPDAYQIESSNPLKPLETPYFAKEDREARREALQGESGLVRLYNDLLRLNLPFAVLVRLMRRILGFKAAGDEKTWYRRWGVRTVEILKIWRLIGSVLARVSFVLPPLARALLPGRSRSKPADAETLIFHFRLLTATVRCLITVFAFMLLLTLWLGIGLFPAWLVIILSDQSILSSLEILLGVYLFPVVLVWLLTFSWRQARESLLGVVQSLWLIAKWMIVVVLVTGVVMLVSRLVVPVSNYIAAYFSGSRSLDAGVAGLNQPVAAIFSLNGLPNLNEILHWIVFLTGHAAVWTIAGVAAVVWLWTSYKNLRSALSGLRDFGSKPGILTRILASYNVADALFQPYPLKAFFSSLFDPNYYGKPDLDTIVDDALSGKDAPSPRTRVEKRKVAHYCAPQRKEPIHVGMAVADVLDGRVRVVPETESIVDGLVAAVAMVPLFPAQRIDGRLYVDGTNVANVPSRALLEMLRDSVNPNSKMVHIYSVVPLPFSRAAMHENEDQKPHLDLVNVVGEALHLQRYRDAVVERRLTEVYSNFLPRVDGDNHPVNRIVIPGEHGYSPLFRAWVTPVELEEPVSLNLKIMSAGKDEQRRVITETIADGCRAALQMMIARSATDAAGGRKIVSCREAVRQHFSNRSEPANLKGRVADMALPGSSPDSGPGLKEICDHCALNRGKKNQARRCLRLGDWKKLGPEWPHEREECDKDLDTKAGPPPDPHFVPRQSDEKSIELIKGWPAPRMLKPPAVPIDDLLFAEEWGSSENYSPAPGLDESPTPELASRSKLELTSGDDRPTISLLFSGGVFRGVFQMGVLNALNELNLKPDIIAGASVGSITAAMIAKTFSLDSKCGDTCAGEHDCAVEPTDDFDQLRRPNRHAQIARLAAVYLGIDRIILTDRFADFVRGLTIRAAGTQISLRQADRFFRKYDFPKSGRFSKRAREVIAGIERLFYINPYQLNALVRSMRGAEWSDAFDQLKTYAQQWLDRFEVSDQILGAEALETLIGNFVVPDDDMDHPGLTHFNVFDRSKIHFLATTTNVSAGRLEVIGGPLPFDAEVRPAMLQEGLLASSAFPAVFKPRRSWDLYPGGEMNHQYIDGGVMDNFPIDSVIQVLLEAGATLKEATIAVRPRHGPHLILAASLQVDTPELNFPDEWQDLEHNWPALKSRAGHLGYNRKLDIYRAAERNLQRLYRALSKHNIKPEIDPKTARERVPTNIEVLIVKPQWLPGTFAFHPMLGFRRKKQARSIAHGCAATLLEVARARQEYRDAWGVHHAAVPWKVRGFGQAMERWKAYKKANNQADTRGDCWLRPGVPCPFSRNRLDHLNAVLRQGADGTKRPNEIKSSALKTTTVKELAKIHTYCKKPETHRPEGDPRGLAVKFARWLGVVP